MANGNTQKALATPNVVAYARQFYNCSTWPSVPLEDDGGSGTANSHFERSYFFSEAMTGSTSAHMVYSGFTWSVLKDSGWYGVNLANSEVFTAGQN